MYQKVFFEISGRCQARCPHCCTGNKSLKAYPCRFIPVLEFDTAVERLIHVGLAADGTQFELYNWGEPFLHPDLPEILSVLTARRLNYRLSTNAGIYRQLPLDVIQGMKQLTITIPGFSQNSYDRVHGFKFDSVMENILRYANDFGRERIRITYLIHQFNLHEIYEAYHFFDRQEIKISCTVAYMNDYNMSRDYLENKLMPDRLKKAGQDLILGYVEELIRAKPVGYRCPQFSILAIDEFCNVLTCCAVPKDHSDYSLGLLTSLSAETILREKERRSICVECQRLGIDYWIHTSPKPKYWGQLTGESIKIIELIYLFWRKIQMQMKRITQVNF